MEREFHPVANIFPLMEGQAFDKFVEDVRANGQREPVTLHPDGRVVDGRNRYRACQRIGIEAKYRTWDESVNGDLVKFVCSLNLQRRHLDESQRAMVAARIANLTEGRPSKTPPMGGVSQPGAADLMNVGYTSVQRAKKVLSDGATELVQAVERGDVSVRQAADIATMEPERQLEIVAMPKPERQKAVDRIRSERKAPPTETDFQLRKAMAMPDAGAGSVRKWPKKADVDQVRNAVLHMQGIADALGKIDMSLVVEHPECVEWRKSMKGVMSALNKFYKELLNASTEGSEHVSRRVS